MFMATRDEQRCVGCGECIVVCPQSQPASGRPVLVSPRPGDIPVVAHAENCIQCLSCVDVCRASAITFHDAYVVPRLIVDPWLEEAMRRFL
jgi:NAD-dependent dihydropyrimidine dehydrogenase PreA subunit